MKTIFSFSVFLSVVFSSCDYSLYYPEHLVGLFLALSYSWLLWWPNVPSGIIKDSYFLKAVISFRTMTILILLDTNSDEIYEMAMTEEDRAFPVFFTHFSLHRSCRLSGSRTTPAVSAVSSVMRALMECPSLWTLKIRSTASKTTTGERHLLHSSSKEHKRMMWSYLC